MDEENYKISFASMLLISGVSCILFSFIMKMLEGDHSYILLTIGYSTSALSILIWLGKTLLQNGLTQKKRNQRITP